MLTDAFYVALAAALRGRSGEASAFFLAVGGGDPGWDTRAPPEQRETARLVAEAARLEVPRERVVFLDEAGAPTDSPTPRLQLSATFGPTEAVGALRECGLFGGDATGEPDTGTLLSYFIHPRIDKPEGMALSRTISVHLTPQAVVPGTRPTRYLGNSYSTELHDLQNTRPGCRLEEIRFDRRYFFPSVEAAAAGGYDFCAYCFGRELSQR
jgi:hypothetical protein